MKSIRISILLLAGAALPFSANALWADDWKTTDGKVYHEVKVIAAQPDAVTILHQDGGALVPLANLTPDLQKKFNYDPATAKAAAEDRARENAANGVALQAEMDEASRMRQPGYESPDADTTEADSSPVHEEAAQSSAPVYSDPNHHSMDELVSSLHSMKSDAADATHHSVDEMATLLHSMKSDPTDATHHSVDEMASSAHSIYSDPTDANHHTIDELSESADSVRRDLYEANYHTMAHLAYAISSQGLGPDQSDPNHYSMSDLDFGL